MKFSLVLNFSEKNVLKKTYFRFSFGVEETFLGELSDINGGVFFFIFICLVFSLSYLYKNICCRKNQKRELERDTTGSSNSTKDYECKVLNEADHDSIEFIEQDDTHSNYICYYAFSGRLAVYDLSTNSLIAQGISFKRSCQDSKFWTGFLKFLKS